MAIPKKIGDTNIYTVRVTYIGEHQYKQPYAKRLATQQRNEERAKKLEAERKEKELVSRRARIMNQVELAFVKNGKEAMQFITCDECEDLATQLLLTHLNPGSDVISPEQVAGARCEACKISNHWMPFKTKAHIECSRLEFFFDGIKQICIKAPARA